MDGFTFRFVNSIIFNLFYRTYRASRSPRPNRQHRCSKYDPAQEEQQQRSCITKVQKWSDDLEMETTFEANLPTEEISYERPSVLKT